MNWAVENGVNDDLSRLSEAIIVHDEVGCLLETEVNDKLGCLLETY